MIKAVIFDFDGVIADTEELHFTCLKEILHQEGIIINRQMYDETYLALDDKNCFRRAFAIAKSKELSHQKTEELIKRKADLLQSNLTEVKLFSGISEWIKKHSSEVLLGICSGALHREIAQILSKHSLLKCFTVIVTAEDVENSKPSPEGYLLALQRLREISGGHIAPSECLVIEDSVAGIEAAKAALMHCVAITNSYSREKLCQADVIFGSILELSLERLNIQLRPPDILPSG
jgi:HAD superfamily hydrolase (TIGR01509 family)